ncbi:hypothetical protein EYF80_037466 [Liparis tanakae]|uniref:Uncharacterized protein n=1 Tax=Liparis tanakae TaxID=230148 RepID=A0A4Z2GI24_9TELE|nr:hypothetical protein EYF80_037466 [Liparis tanakae]
MQTSLCRGTDHNTGKQITALIEDAVQQQLSGRQLLSHTGHRGEQMCPGVPSSPSGTRGVNRAATFAVVTSEAACPAAWSETAGQL